MQNHIVWDDLRTLLAVAEQGSLAGAARVLGVNHSTVFRRVKDFEQAHALRLFDRLPSGYVLTPGGEELLAAAREMKAVVDALERRLAGQDLRPEGELRVTTTDTLLHSVLPDVLRRFRAAFPGITLEISGKNSLANLAERDADVAIRGTQHPPESLVGRRVCGIAFALYATPGATPACPWIGTDASLAASSVGRWMQANVAPAAVALRADSLLSLRQAALAGIGRAVLPCYLGDTTPGLVRLQPQPIAGLETSLWVLTHEDLRRSARVRTFTGFLAEALVPLVPLFEGQGAPTP
jgi:DNA-binding transcriptional LysR family regulator